MKIHVSETTKELLDQYGGFSLERRGTIEIKVCLIKKLILILTWINYHREKVKWILFGYWVMRN